jgi:hypothetical protein
MYEQGYLLPFLDALSFSNAELGLANFNLLGLSVLGFVREITRRHRICQEKLILLRRLNCTDLAPHSQIVDDLQLVTINGRLSHARVSRKISANVFCLQKAQNTEPVHLANAELPQ